MLAEKFKLNRRRNNERDLQKPKPSKLNRRRNNERDLQKPKPSKLNRRRNNERDLQKPKPSKLNRRRNNERDLQKPMPSGWAKPWVATLPGQGVLFEALGSSEFGNAFAIKFLQRQSPPMAVVLSIFWHESQDDWHANGKLASLKAVGRVQWLC